MKVKDLIKALKKMPQDVDVYWADHDHGQYETGGEAGQVLLIDKEEMNEYVNDKDCGISDVFTKTPTIYVCLRPR